MNRLALALLAVVVAVAVLVAIARQTSEKPTATPADPSPRPRAGASVTPEAAPAAADPNDLQLEVKELALADGGADRTSIRIEHPDPAMLDKLRGFLEPREQAAIAKNTALDCHAQIAKTSLVSITCVTLIPDSDGGGVEPDGGRAAQNALGAPSAHPHYESLTLRFVGGQVRTLALADVLAASAGQNEVIEGCKKAAEPDLACEWPPTDFAISPGGTLFLCHGSHCIDIDQADAPGLLRPEFR